MADHDHLAARLLSDEAHALRNHVATLRSVVQLLDDVELADAVGSATSALQVAIERAVALARLELDEVPDTVVIDLSVLVVAAMRRARREGAPIAAGEKPALLDVAVCVPGTWAERLLADLFHHAGAQPVIGAIGWGDLVEVVVELERAPDALVLDGVVALARACGGELEIGAGSGDDHVALLRLPISAG